MLNSRRLVQAVFNLPKNFLCFFLIMLFCTSVSFTQTNSNKGKPTISIDADFPSGNIQLDSISGNDVYLHQDLHDTERNWFYWYFRVKSTAGKKLTFHFTHPWEKLARLNVVGAQGAGVSLDGGHTWSWLGTKGATETSFEYTYPANAKEVRLSMGMPYTESNLNAFLQKYKTNPDIEKSTLVLTREGRKVERLHVGNIHGEPQYRIVFTARHHACEMMADYLIEGIIERVLAKGEEGEWFRKNVEILIIPFIDKDGVENGDQGKYRRARDHNRDYSAESIYASTLALKNYLPVWSNGKMVAGIDLHCPFIRGGEHEQIHLVGLANKEVEQQQEKFSTILEKLSQANPSLPYKLSYNIPYGTSWNNDANNTKGKSFAKWVSEFKEVKLATTIEFPYATASGKMITQENARAYGHIIAKAMYEYLLSIAKKGFVN